MKKNAAMLIFPLLVACHPDDPHGHNEQEVITRVTLEMNSPDCAPVRAVASDPDGNGGKNPIIDTIVLRSPCTYNVNIQFADETKKPVLDITNEIAKEADDHLVCFELLSGLNQQHCEITITDTDSKGRKLGLKSLWKAKSPGVGKIKVELKHQPKGKKNERCDSGDTDVSVEFVTVIR